MTYGPTRPALQLPQLEPWMQRALQWVAGVYVVEIGLRAAKLPVDSLELHALSDPAFRLWQPFTHFFVQGDWSHLFGVALGVLVLVFFLPALEQILTMQQIKSSLTAIVCGAVFLPYVLEATGLIGGGNIYGWQRLLIGMLVLYGLARPNQAVYLFFVIPIRASFFVWGSLGLGLLFFVGDQTVHTAEPIGAWAGAYAWWHIAGPAGRRRALLREAARVEEALHRFEVLEGGRQGDQSPPEEWH